MAELVIFLLSYVRVEEKTYLSCIELKFDVFSMVLFYSRFSMQLLLVKKRLFQVVLHSAAQHLSPGAVQDQGVLLNCRKKIEKIRSASGMAQ